VSKRNRKLKEQEVVEVRIRLELRESLDSPACLLVYENPVTKTYMQRIFNTKQEAVTEFEAMHAVLMALKPLRVERMGTLL